MAAMLDNIKDDQALLLMYLADELSPADHYGVARRLESQPALAQKLAELQANHALYLQALNLLDSKTPPPIPDEAATQQASRMIHRWAAARLAKPRRAIQRPPMLPRWVYPLAAAASLVIAIVIWGVNRHQVEITRGLSAEHRNDQVADDSQPTTPPDALAELDDQQQQDLLDGSIATLTNDAARANSALDEADNTIAALGKADDLDNLLPAWNSDAPPAAHSPSGGMQ